ncbi:MAG TPA: PH domain-containing protein [Mycobacteriales bacterium]|nr:PH domain-containing protein [Mycobacteriales bacterium]
MAGALPLRAPAHRVSPAAQWLWAVQGAVVTVVVAAVVIGLSIMVPDDVPRWFEVVLAVARWLLVPLALVSVVVEPLWRFRVHRWEVTADAVYTLEGWLTRTWRVVPISRIQTVDTTRGPLQQLLGLTSVSVRTASHAGSTSIEQLPAELAAAVAHDLGLRANAIRDEAT